MAEIVINDIEPLNGYTSSGGELGFDYDFPIFDADDLVVLEIETDGTVNTLVRSTDYSVSGTGLADGGSITFDVGVYPDGAIEDYRYVLYRDLAVSRVTDFLTGGDFKAETMNRELDKLVMMLQQNELEIKRSLGLQKADAEDEINFEIETAAARADKVLIFGASGNTVKAGPTSGDITTVANSISNVNLVGGSIANVNTVAGSISNVNTVAGNITNVNTVAGISSNVTTVAGDSTDIGTLAGISADLQTLADLEDGTTVTNGLSTLAGISANITTVAGISANVTTVAGDSTDIQALGPISADIQTLADIEDGTTATGAIQAVAAVDSDVTTVAGIAANVTTVAGIQANVTTVAGIQANVTTVAGIAADVSAVAAIASDVTDAANNIPKANRTATTDPTVGDDDVDGYSEGSLWVNTITDTIFLCADASTGAAVWQSLAGSLSGLSDTTIASLANNDFLIYRTATSSWENETPANARTAMGLGSLATQNNINNSDWSGTDLAIANGGTGAGDEATARQNLGVEIGVDVEAYDVNRQKQIGSGWAETTEKVACSTIIPLDNTIPQNTEGDEILTLTYDRKSATSTLYIEVSVTGILSTNAAFSATVALFQDSTANALKAAAQSAYSSGASVSIHLRHRMASGGTGNTTFKIRGGPNTSSRTFNVNGDGSGRIFGGVSNTNIRVIEIEE